jgi:hypothetical protein
VSLHVSEPYNKLLLMHLLQFSTCACFEQYLAHLQEVELY